MPQVALLSNNEDDDDDDDDDKVEVGGGGHRSRSEPRETKGVFVKESGVRWGTVW